MAQTAKSSERSGRDAGSFTSVPIKERPCNRERPSLARIYRTVIGVTGRAAPVQMPVRRPDRYIRTPVEAVQAAGGRR
jgi:hypothetical protein